MMAYKKNFFFVLIAVFTYETVLLLSVKLSDHLEFSDVCKCQEI